MSEPDFQITNGAVFAACLTIIILITAMAANSIADKIYKAELIAAKCAKWDIEN